MGGPPDLDEAVDPIEDPLVHPLEDGEEQLVLGREVLIDRPLADPGAIGDGRHRHRVEALLREDLGGGTEDERPLLPPGCCWC